MHYLCFLITDFDFIFRYTKYLYPLECKKNNLSNPSDLQVAIEGNKREGRRTSYGTFPGDLLPPHPMQHMPNLPISMAGSHASPIPPIFGAPGLKAPMLNGANGSPHLPPCKSPFDVNEPNYECIFGDFFIKLFS